MSENIEKIKILSKKYYPNYKGIEGISFGKMSFEEQMGNIGSEVGRAAKWQSKDENHFWGAVTRAMELFDLTQSDKRWENRLSEIINRAKEVFADAVLGGKEYKSSLKSLEEYFMQFALYHAQTLGYLTSY